MYLLDDYIEYIFPLLTYYTLIKPPPRDYRKNRLTEQVLMWRENKRAYGLIKGNIHLVRKWNYYFCCHPYYIMILSCDF